MTEPETKPLILHDLDDSAAPTTRDYINPYIERSAPGRFSEQDKNKPKVTVLENPELYQIRQQFFEDAEALLAIRLYPTTLPALELLKSIARLQGLTGRLSKSAAATLAWSEQVGLSKYLESIHFREPHSAHAFHKYTKAIELKPKLIFEDDPEMCIANREIRVFSVMISQEWNLNLADGEYIKRYPDFLAAARDIVRFPSLDDYIEHYNKKKSGQMTNSVSESELRV